jgi:hypothetical protein
VAGRRNVIVETTLPLAAVRRTIAAFRDAEYPIEATVVAAPQDHARRMIVRRFLEMQARGDAPRFGSDATYPELRETVAALAQEKLVDRLRVVTRGGAELYSDAPAAVRWLQPDTALAALDAERERAGDLAQNAVAWHVLEAHARRNPNTPAQVLEQTVAWRQEAIERALADPDSAKRYRLSLTAEAFRTMPPERFVREFSDYAGAAERLAQAMQHAGKAYPTRPTARRL